MKIFSLLDESPQGHSVQMGLGMGSSLSTDGMLDPCELVICVQ